MIDAVRDVGLAGWAADNGSFDVLVSSRPC